MLVGGFGPASLCPSEGWLEYPFALSSIVHRPSSIVHRPSAIADVGRRCGRAWCRNIAGGDLPN